MMPSCVAFGHFGVEIDVKWLSERCGEELNPSAPGEESQPCQQARQMER